MDACSTWLQDQHYFKDQRETSPFSLPDSRSYPKRTVSAVPLTRDDPSTSVVLTALLASGLMWPVKMRIQRQVWELKILRMSIQNMRRVMQTCDPKDLAENKKIGSRADSKINIMCVLDKVFENGRRWVGSVLLLDHIKAISIHITPDVSKQIAKLSKTLGVPYVPVTASDQERIMASVITVMREFIDVRKDKK
ncbi:hypothetical protein F2Q69_00010334 [Brassica cretica]|uniref:Uncharacterized protein n=1 Tax=Brassica cretica TaxID=69181 RepID=A0A8S9QRL5_BRACR|nr:hypothetical protein F2Q69_00010334 [Brassica cretica]